MTKIELELSVRLDIRRCLRFFLLVSTSASEGGTGRLSGILGIIPRSDCRSSRPPEHRSKLVQSELRVGGTVGAVELRASGGYNESKVVILSIPEH